jgi:phosphoglycolate phosphatase-like HAD superfamily hydrolase
MRVASVPRRERSPRFFSPPFEVIKAIPYESMHNVRAFIFDIDGTLIDSNELHVDSWDRAFRKFEKQFPREELRAQIGKGTDQYLPEFLTKTEIAEFGKDLDEYRSEIFRKEYLPRVKPFPKVRELFQRIRGDGKRIMLATSGKKKDTKYYVDLLKIDNLIEGYTSAEDADRSKPAPDIFSAALEKLGENENGEPTAAGEAIAVGDTRFDVEAAAKIGLKTIALTCGGTTEEALRKAGAIAIYADPADLLAHFDRFLKCDRVTRE